MRFSISGVGLICSLGDDASQVFAALMRGERAIDALSLFDTAGYRSNIAAQVRALPSAPKSTAPWSRSDVMAWHAATRALASAGLASVNDRNGLRIGLVVGGTTGGMFETEAMLARMHTDASLRVPTSEMLTHPLSSTVDRLREMLGPIARARTVCSACSSGANAFAIGAAWLAADLVDVALVGGTDGLCRLTYAGFGALGALDPNPAMPFDAGRKGLTIGEGAGFAVLERPDRARARGLRPSVALVGVGITSEAHHITNPSEDGEWAATAMRRALSSAGLDASHVDYVNAHGTATPLNDAMEATAIERALGAHASRAWVSSTKGAIGHTLGAAGAIEAVIAAMALEKGQAPPTAGLTEVDPRCASLRHVPKDGVRETLRASLSNSFGFGGVDTVLAFAREELDAGGDRSALRVYVHGIGSCSPLGVVQAATHTSLDALPATAATSERLAEVLKDLDPARARRLDKTAKIATTAAKSAIDNGTIGTIDLDETGVILGSAYGDPDGSAAFLARLFEKGPRLVAPAEFPNLVPSSPTGHLAIYLGLHGPSLVSCDLSTSGESALCTAHELLSAGFFTSLIAGSIEPPGEIAASCLGPTFSSQAEQARGFGAAVMRLSTTPSNVELLAWSSSQSFADIVPLLPDPKSNSSIFVGNPTHVPEWGPSAWGSVRVSPLPASLGRHEGLGAFAAAVAAAHVGQGTLDEALVVGALAGRSYALLLRRVLTDSLLND